MDRQWVNVTDEERADEELFTAMSWNTLCDRYCTQQQYGYSPSTALAWEHRRQLILDEVRGRDPDIFCMQEADGENFNEYFRPNLAANDYKGVFFPKTRSRTMAEKDAKTVDGCATFWKNSKYVKQYLQSNEHG